MASLIRVDLPEFGMPDAMPELQKSLYPARLARLRVRAETSGYDRLVTAWNRHRREILDCRVRRVLANNGVRIEARPGQRCADSIDASISRAR